MADLLFGREYWHGKCVNCLGDSITFGVNNDGVSWADMLAELIPFRAVRKYGVCGSTISRYAGRNDSFCERYAGMTSDYDLLILFGGVNDFNHSLPLGNMESREQNMFYGALHEIITGLFLKQPTSEILCVTPIKSFCIEKGYPHWNKKNEAGYKLVDYRNAIIDIAEYYSIPVLDLFMTSGMTPDHEAIKQIYLSDGLHPTKEGYQRIARKIAAFIS